MRPQNLIQHSKARLLFVMILAVGALAWFIVSQQTIPDPDIQSLIDPVTGSPATKYKLDGGEVIIANEFIAHGITAVAYGSVVAFEFYHPVAEFHDTPIARGDLVFSPEKLQRITARIIPGKISESQFEQIQRIAMANDSVARDSGKYEISKIKDELISTEFGLYRYDIIASYDTGDVSGQYPVGSYYIPMEVEEQIARPHFSIYCASTIKPSLVQNCEATFNFLLDTTFMYQFPQERLSEWRDIEKAVFRIAHVRKAGS